MTSAYATDLLDAYRLGIRQDPTYNAAVANYLTEKEASPQARSAIFPQIESNADLGHLHRELVSGPGGQANLETYNFGVNLSQVLFDGRVFDRISEARSTVKQAAYILAAAKQDLMVRVARAYFNVLLAQDNLSYSIKQRDGAYQQLKDARERHKMRHETITSLERFRGQYESLRALAYSDEIALSNQQQALEEIIGREHGKLVALKNEFPLKKPVPAKLTAWLEKARQANLSVSAARYGLLAARKNINFAFGGHYPTLNAIAAYEHGQSPTVLTLTNTETASVRFNLNIPIFQGGLINSQVRAAKAQYQLASAQLEGTYRSAVAETTKAYCALKLGVNQLAAESSAVKYNLRALRHVEEGYKAGVETTLDVIEQQTRLLTAQRTYARDKYTYLINMLLLQQAVGTLKPESLASIEAAAML